MLKGCGAPSLAQLRNKPFVYSAMSSGNTAAANSALFVSEVAAAIAEDKTLLLPSGTIPFGYTDGTSSTISFAKGDKLRIEGMNTVLQIPKGDDAIPFIFSTEAGWVDYAITAISTVLSGGDMSTATEVTMVTVTSPPTFSVGDMVSVYSRDKIEYGNVPVSGDYELNYQHEIAEVLSVDGNDIYLSRKLTRTYTTAGLALRVYNNTGSVFEIDNVEFSTDDDPFSDSILSTQRPTFCFEIIGFVRPKVGRGVKFSSVYAGTASFNSTAYAEYSAEADQIVNKTATQTVLGYGPRYDGVNFMPTVLGNLVRHGRHQPTTSWIEESKLTISSTNFVAGGVTTRLGYSAATGSEPDVGDFVYVDVSGVTGTINTLPVAWYEVTGKNTTSNWFEFAFDSTGLTFTSGTGTGLLFQPGSVRRYGETEGLQIKWLRAVFAHGATFDEHESAISTNIIDGDARFCSGFSWSSTSGYAVNNRGANMTVDGFYCESYSQFAIISSFGMNHGVENTATFNNIRLHNQADKDSGVAYFETVGAATVTDKRKLIINNLTVTGTYNSVLNHAADAGDVEINGLNLLGVWGNSGTGTYAIRSAGGHVVIHGGMIDLTNCPASTRIAQVTGGRLTFKNVCFKNLAATAASMIDARTGSGIVVEFIDCTFGFSADATDTTCRFFGTGSAITMIVNMKNCHIVNSTKIGSSGLVRAGVSGSAITLNHDGVTYTGTLTAFTSATGGASVTKVAMSVAT